MAQMPKKDETMPYYWVVLTFPLKRGFGEFLTFVTCTITTKGQGGDVFLKTHVGYMTLGGKRKKDKATILTNGNKAGYMFTSCLKLQLFKKSQKINKNIIFHFLNCSLQMI